MVSNDAIQLGPKEFLPSHIFRRVLYNIGCINGENYNGVWIAANRNLANSGGVNKKIMNIRSKGGRDKKV